MTFFTWSDRYSVGIRRIDEQHRELVNLLNRLYEAMYQGHGRDALGKVLDGLIRYTARHFAAEEELMRRHGYGAFESHREKHRKMAEKVASLQARYRSGEISSPVQISNFLKGWLTQHIMETDKAFGDFLVGKGER